MIPGSWGRKLGEGWRWIRQTPPGAGEHELSRFVFLRLLGFVYFIAFLSLANQILPLIGSDGLLPARSYLERVRARHGWLEHPTIFWSASSDSFLLTAAWTGTILSALLAAGFANSIHLFLLWALYLSFVQIGQEWYGYGWESQLLETGFLAIFICPLLDPRPFPRRPAPIQVIWLLRWLVIRIMLGAGLIKLRGDPAWRDLTALFYHYETQPIPNPLSRYLHFAPGWVHRLGCLWNHCIELVVPFLSVYPPRLRRLGGLLLASFQILLILSGNLSFLNWLTLAATVAFFDDGVWRGLLPGRLVAWADRARAQAVRSAAQNATAWALVAVVALLSLAPLSNLLSPGQTMNRSFDPFRLVNTYGAFGSVGRERYEIILEGTDDPSITDATPWRAYEFKAKPGDPDRALPLVSPYHYRLDWQIWFAAMDRPGEDVWLVHLIWKLLHNDPGALSLLGNRPFPDHPPTFIRAEFYRYQFTRPACGASGPWKRTRVKSWLPPLSKDDPGFRRFLADCGFIKE